MQQINETDIRKELKNEYKNYISNGLKIYYSKNRPIAEIYNFLDKDIKENSHIWENNERFLISNLEINKEDLIKNELKEFDFNIMDLNECRIILNYEVLFDLCSIDLKGLLKPYNAEIKHITSLYKEWVNVKDLINITKNIIKEYYKGGINELQHKTK